MEYEQLVSRETLNTTNNTQICSTYSQLDTTTRPKLNHGMTSFRGLEEGAPSWRESSVEKKLSWLRSQVIGGDVEFETPYGTRRLTYADHTASGRSLHYVENYIIGNVLPFYGNSHTTDSYVGSRTTKTAHEASEYVKKCLGGGQEDVLLFCGSGTTAAIKRLQEVMGIAVPSILRERVVSILANEERWVVFVGPYEHHSNILSWRESLAEVVEIGLDENGLIDMEDLRESLRIYQCTHRPMLGSFSACSNVTGTFSDTRAIAGLLHQFGAFACFDFAASGPYVEIEMRSGEMEGYDAVFLSPHKFLGGPGSPGILLMGKSLYMLGNSPPSTAGGGTVDFVNGFSNKDTLYVENIEEREDGGTPPIIQKTRAALAFWVKEYIGYETIEKQEQSYILRAIKRLAHNKNVSVLGNTTAKRQAIMSFLIYSNSHSSSSFNQRNDRCQLCMWKETGDTREKPLHGPFVAKLLNDLFGVQARGGCACAGPYGHSLLKVDEKRSLAFRSAIQMGYHGVKPGWTRISFPYYMSDEEFEFILAAVEFLAMYGQRFLPLYHFNWKTGVWTFKKRVLKEAFMSLNSEEFKVQEQQQHHVVGVDLITKYASYLEKAKYLATILPKFPTQREVPDDIDLDLLPFRV